MFIFANSRASIIPTSRTKPFVGVHRSAGVRIADVDGEELPKSTAALGMV
jgi:hypothetical protein